MLLSRVLGGVGRFFISVGVLTLLFVSYQLWGTGILTAQAQNDLENEFETILAQAEEIKGEPIDTVIDNSQVTVAADDPAVTDEKIAAYQAEREALGRVLWQPPGKAVANLSIPAIGLGWVIVEGVGVDELRLGPGHYPGTPLPGMAGNASVAGHRTTYGAPFNRIDELAPGDEIDVITAQGLSTYRVMEQKNGKGHFIVSPDRVDVLGQGFTDSPNRLTLTACHPKFSSRERIIVVAELVGDPYDSIPRPAVLGDAGDAQLASEELGTDVPDEAGLPGDPALVDEAGEPDPTPTPAVAAPTEPSPSTTVSSGVDGAGGGGPSGGSDTFGEGLSGDRGAIFPAFMWGLAAGAIWMAAAFIAQRWRKVPSYAIGLIPFAVVLFICFSHIDQALPSY